MGINVIDTIRPKNGGSFPVVEAENVSIGSEKLDEAFAEVKANVNPNLCLLASIAVAKYDEDLVLQANGNPQSCFKIAHGIYGMIAIDAKDDSTKGETDGVLYIVDTINQEVVTKQTIEKCRHANSACVVDRKLYVSRSWDSVICVYDMDDNYSLESQITCILPDVLRIDSIAYTGEFWVAATGNKVYKSNSLAEPFVSFFELPMAYPIVGDTDMFRVGTLSYNPENSCYYVAATTPNFIAKLDAEGNLIASYNTDTAYAEPEQVCFDDGLIIMAAYNNLSTHRLIELYAIDENTPYPAWRAPQWGLDYLFVDTETTSLVRDGSYDNPFATIDEIFLYYKAENVRDIKFRGTLNNEILTSKNIRVHRWDSESIAVFNRITVEASSCMFFDCTFVEPEGQRSALLSRAATTILEGCSFQYSNFALLGNGAVTFNNSTPYSLVAMFDGCITGNNAQMIMNTRIHRNAAKQMTYCNYVNATEVTIDERKLGEYVVLELGANSGHHSVTYKLSNIATGSNISMRFPLYSALGFALYAYNLKVTRTEVTPGDDTSPASGGEVIDGDGNLIPASEVDPTEPTVTYTFQITKGSVKDIDGNEIAEPEDIKILYLRSM